MDVCYMLCALFAMLLIHYMLHISCFSFAFVVFALLYVAAVLVYLIYMYLYTFYACSH